MTDKKTSFSIEGIWNIIEKGENAGNHNFFLFTSFLEKYYCHLLIIIP